MENWQGLMNQLAAIAHAMLLVKDSKHEMVPPSAYTRTRCQNYYEEMFVPFALGELIDIDELYAFAQRERVQLLAGRPNNWLIQWKYIPLIQNTTTKQALLDMLNDTEDARVIYLGNTLQCCGSLDTEGAGFMKRYFESLIPPPVISQVRDHIIQHQDCLQGKEFFVWHVRLEADYYVYRLPGDVERIIGVIGEDMKRSGAKMLYICTGLVGDDLLKFIAQCREQLASEEITVCTKTTLAEDFVAAANLNCEQGAMVDWSVARHASRFYGCLKSSFSITLGIVLGSEKSKFVDDNYSHCPTTDWSTFGFNHESLIKSK